MRPQKPRLRKQLGHRFHPGRWPRIVLAADFLGPIESDCLRLLQWMRSARPLDSEHERHMTPSFDWDRSMEEWIAQRRRRWCCAITRGVYLLHGQKGLRYLMGISMRSRCLLLPWSVCQAGTQLEETPSHRSHWTPWNWVR